MLINNETPTPPRGSTYRVNDRRETPTPSKTSDYPRDVKLPREDEIPRLPRTYAFTPIDTARIGKPTNAAEYSMHGSIPPIRRAPRRDERMDTAARYMHAARRKVENDYTFDRSDPPKTRGVETSTPEAEQREERPRMVEIPLGRKWDEHSDRAAKYMQTAWRKTEAQSAQRREEPRTVELPLDPRWEKHKDRAAKYMQAARRKTEA
jgi:hypothetical protein